MQLLVDFRGTIRCVYDEAIPLGTIGSLTICRASHVEPDANGQWLADLSPVQGPKLGPFNCRSLALVAERDWLESRWLARQL